MFFDFFLWPKLIFFWSRGHGPMAPLKYATAYVTQCQGKRTTPDPVLHKIPTQGCHITRLKYVIIIIINSLY